MVPRREIWFRNFVKWAPWTVVPVHWKGWLVLIGGPVLLVVAGNVQANEPMIELPLFLVGAFVIVILIYSHTAWDRG